LPLVVIPRHAAYQHLLHPRPDVAPRALVIGLLSARRQADPDPLGWIKLHLLNPYAITAAATVLLVVVPFVLLRLDRQRRTDSAKPSAKDRAIMLQRMRNKWIVGVLQPSLADTEHLDLGLHRYPDAVPNLEQPAERRYAPAAIPAGKTIGQIFDEVGGGLLILGGPGSGKTTLLLQLARALLDRAAADPREPIPIVANLSSWASRQQSLAVWLADEIAVHQYRLPAKAFNYWLSRNKIAILLDGLDEVDVRQRDACAAAINAFRREHGLTGLAVCCLTSEAAKLGARLQLEEAVELELPTDTQVDNFLHRVEDSGTPVADIRRAIAADGELRDLLRSPLMLHVVTRACQGAPGIVLQQPESAEVRLYRLWEEYLQSMFQRRPIRRGGQFSKSREQQVHWLEWLATTLRDRGETEFYLDRLTMEWLPSPTRKHWRLVEYLSQALSEYIRPVEGLHWSWRKLRSRLFIQMDTKGPMVAIGSMFISVGAGFLGIFAWIVFSPISIGGRSASFILSGIVLGLCCVGVVLLSLGWTTELQDARTTPNEGIRRSARNGLLVALPAAAVFGLVFGLADAHIFKLGNALIFGLIAGMITGLFIGLVFGFGACIAHYVVRALLAGSGAAPWRYGWFLDAMSSRQMVRRCAGSYMFAHQQLRNHLADRAAVSPSKGWDTQTTANKQPNSGGS
jgi:hypothetical protein